jgi:hypothetical protein
MNGITLKQSLLSAAAAAALLAGQAVPAHAQSADALRRENAQLRAQLDALNQRCGVPAPDDTGALERFGDIEARLDSIRAGQRTRGSVEITVTMTLRNVSSQPMVLNYEYDTFNATDSHGYTYRFFGGQDKDTIKGIPIATTNRVDPTFTLLPGRSSTVTFLVQRAMNEAQTPGSRFDISASFGQYENLGQGRLRRLQTFPVSFKDRSVTSGGVATGIGGRADQTVENAAGRLLDRLFK